MKTARLTEPSWSGERGSEAMPATPCSQVRGRVAKLGLMTDVPIPRCARVTPGQRIMIVNRTGAYHRSEARPVTARLGGYSARLKPQEAVLFPRPAGAFLGRGSFRARTTYVGAPAVLVLPEDCEIASPIPKGCLSR